MIRLGPTPEVFYNPPQNDMSHFSPSEYGCSIYFYVSDEFYLKLLTFTDPSLLEPPKEVLEGEINWEEIMGSSIAKRIDYAIKLNPQKSQLWQFDALGPNMEDRFIHVACLGVRHFVIWSLFDVYVRLPFNKIKCYLLNKTLYFKRKKEIADWDRFLKQVHEKVASRQKNDVNHWFELSYAQYLTIPRSVLEEMPLEWQVRFVKCLEELDDTLDWRPKEGRYWVKLRDAKGRYMKDPLAEYRVKNFEIRRKE